jgi:hypothetical protein
VAWFKPQVMMDRGGRQANVPRHHLQDLLHDQAHHQRGCDGALRRGPFPA